MMTNVMTSSEREGLNGTKIAKVNEEVKKKIGHNLIMALTSCMGYR